MTPEQHAKLKQNHEAERAIPFLERLGFEFELDWDESLEISAPDSVSPDDVLTALQGAHEIIRLYILRRSRLAKHVCVGGPCNGRLHQSWCGCALMYHLARARWAGYRVSHDGRAWFVGEFSSERKARIGVDEAVEAAKKVTERET